MGRCVRGCDVEKHGNICAHLNWYLLRTGNIKPFVVINHVPPGFSAQITSSNEDKETRFRDLMRPFVAERGTPGLDQINKVQVELLVLRFVYDMSYDKLASELSWSKTKVIDELAIALKIIKPGIKEYLKKRREDEEN